VRHHPNHNEILCYRNGQYVWECESCTYQETAKQGELKQPEKASQFQLRLEAA
jgi:Zn-finger protein